MTPNKILGVFSKNTAAKLEKARINREKRKQRNSNKPKPEKGLDKKDWKKAE